MFFPCLSVKILDRTYPPKVLLGFTSNFQELLLKIPIFASSSVVLLSVKILVRSSPAKLLGGLTYASFKVFCNFFEVFCTCYYLSFFTFFYRNNTGPIPGGGRNPPFPPLEAGPERWFIWLTLIHSHDKCELQWPKEKNYITLNCRKLYNIRYSQFRNKW